MEPRIIFIQCDRDGYVKICAAELEKLVHEVYEAGKGDARRSIEDCEKSILDKARGEEHDERGSD